MRTAAPQDRRAYWTAVSQYVIEAKDLELRKGLDKDGNPMAALAAKTIANRHSDMGPADPNAPPLQPAHGLSRTRSLFTAEPNTRATAVVCWWRYDGLTSDSWGEILEYHRQGSARLPVRDVIGLSPQSLATVKRRSAAWWLGYQSGLITPKTPTGSGWGRATPLPGTGPRTAAEINRSPTASPGGRQWTDPTGHVYTMQGGIALKLPKSPPVFASKVPNPRLTIPKPEKLPVPPPAAPVLTLQQFGRKALAAARLVPEAERFTSRKVWIVDAYAQYLKAYPLTTIDEFKRLLLEAHQAGHIELARADTTGWGGVAVLAKDADSTIDTGISQFQAIMIQ